MSSNIEHNHLAFSDDSKHENGRFHSLCLVTFKKDFEVLLRGELSKIFKSSGISDELKWNKVTDAKYRFAAEKIFSYIFQNLDKIRLDILIWDMQDSRHVIDRRHDNKNLVRMYYHLVQTTLSKRWGEDTTWLWLPDHQSEVNWLELGTYIISKKHDVLADIFGTNQDSFRNLKLKAIKPVDSKNEIFVQLADYFAGFGAYSYGHFDRFCLWKSSKNMSLFEKIEEVKFTKAELVRFHLIQLFDERCKATKLQIAFNSSRGFLSHEPNCNINFWRYIPQDIMDKAPVKD